MEENLKVIDDEKAEKIRTKIKDVLDEELGKLNYVLVLSVAKEQEKPNDIFTVNAQAINIKNIKPNSSFLVVQGLVQSVSAGISKIFEVRR